MYSHSRKLLREQKNYERGLKMVPLLIHLPPLSSDTEDTGRDVRDMIDENISKAQILYNIVASTLQKGFKSKFYGQRHFGFEIVAAEGFVRYYAAVPISLMDVVKQAIISAYPSAQLEEVAEHNIFSPVGKINGTVGGELTLKEPYAYPIATYQELKRDAMQSLLNALSTLDKEDGAGIQILIRPADPGWRKTAQSVASKKRKGNDKKKGGEQVLAALKDLGMAIIKPPEEKKPGGDDKPELSSLDQATLDAIDDKTRYPGYEVLIRVVASSNISQRAQAVLNNIVAAFSLYDAPGKNGFKYTVAKDIEQFVTAYIMRFFPQENNQNILNSVELATLFHFPDQKNIPTSQLERQASKQVDGPRNMPNEGLLLGYNVFRGAKKPIRLSLEDRRRHMYVVGQTGVGKSIYLENLALQDMLAGRGFAFVDPHGETVERLISMVPKERTEDVIYFSPADMEYPMGLNLFEFDNPDQKDFIIQEVLNMLYKLYDPQHQGIIGPRYEDMFRNAALAVMADPAGGTFIEIPQLFRDPQFLAKKLKFVTDRTVLDFWQKQYPASQRSNESGEVTAWFVSKFGAFLSNEMMRNMIGQSKSAFNLRDIMDNKKILLVNLSKGRTGDLNSKLLGMIFVMKFQAAAMSRASVPEDQRQDFCLYVDEFQNFSTDSFATILSEARKYRLNLIVANQFTTQLTDEIRDAVFGNVGSIVSFRVGADADADALSKKFQPIFDREDILRLPNYNTVTQMLIGGVPTQPFSMATIPPLGMPNAELGLALRQLSAAKFGRPQSVVEKEIFDRMVVPEPPKPAFGPSPYASPTARPTGPMPGAAGSPAFPPGAPRPAGSGSSFLDEWLAKRKAPAGGGAAVPSSARPITPPPAPRLNVPAGYNDMASSLPVNPSPGSTIASGYPTPAQLQPNPSANTKPAPMPTIPSAQSEHQEEIAVEQQIKQIFNAPTTEVNAVGTSKSSTPSQPQQPIDDGALKIDHSND
ncbi:MAG: type IV secretory system conjugative DNA transfer family protein [Candidatus Saccharimonadales bacterium]